MITDYLFKVQGEQLERCFFKKLLEHFGKSFTSDCRQKIRIDKNALLNIETDGDGVMMLVCWMINFKVLQLIMFLIKNHKVWEEWKQESTGK